MRGDDQRTVARIARETRANGRALVEIGRRLSGEADQLERSLADGEAEVLRGRGSTDKLAELVEVGEKFHYTDLLGLLRAAGYTVAGADPSGSLLAALARADTFSVTSPRSGVYRRVEVPA